MSGTLDADEIDRTTLIALHDGSHETLEAALAFTADTGTYVVADRDTCTTAVGQAALLTATVTASRAFGSVLVIAESAGITVSAGVYTGMDLADAIVACRGVPADLDEIVADPKWPVLLVGATTAIAPDMLRDSECVLRAVWDGWTASVRHHHEPVAAADPTNVLAAIAAGAMATAEAFGFIKNMPGSDAGFRTVDLNLWSPEGTAARPAPPLSHAPQSWWLVGLGHLGQANAWTLAHLPYDDSSKVEVVLQDTDRTVPANHSTGVLTPKGSRGLAKTRLVAAALERAGLSTRIIERRLAVGDHCHDGEVHVALLGVDNLATRRLITSFGWSLAIDVGIGATAPTFASIMLRRFPGAVASDAVPAWLDDAAAVAVTVPDSPAFNALKADHDACGIVELAGRAVGASFVGVVASTLAVAEAIRELHGDPGHDLVLVDLTTAEVDATNATVEALPVSVPLRTSATI